MTSPTPDARIAADNGKSGERWERNKRKISLKVELEAIEQLAERIGFQCNAQLRLADLLVGFQYDPDSLRVIRLALNSMHEALANVERMAAEVDAEEYGVPNRRSNLQASADYDSTGLQAVEDIANDLGVQANAQAYALTLVASRRRPCPHALHAMRYLVGLMNKELASVGG